MLYATLAVVLAAALYAAYARRHASRATAAQTRYEVLAGHLPDVSVMLYDRDRRFTLLEGSALQSHGWGREDVEDRLVEELDWKGLHESGWYQFQDVPLPDGGMIVVRDVTATVTQQVGLEAERRFLAGVFEQLSDFVMACDADGTMQLLNRTMRERYGEVGADVGPLDWPRRFGVRPAGGHAPLAAEEMPLFRALQGEEVDGVELRFDVPGVGVRHVVVSARPVLDGRGEMIGAVSSGLDVTEFREAQLRLQASEERYRSVVESVGDIVFQTDMRGRWTFLNETWTGWTGIPVQEALGRSAWEVVHPADRGRHAAAFAPLAGGKVDVVRLRHRYLTAAGLTRWAEARARLARDAAGQPLGIVGVIEDVTERHRTQQYDAAEQAVIEVLAEARDIEDGVPALLACLCRHLDWDMAELWTLDVEREVLVCTDAWGERRAGLEALEAAREGESFEVGDGLQGQAWARRAPIWASGLQDDPLFRRGPAAEAAGVRSALAMPVARAGHVLAAILFFSREEREPDPGLSRLLQAIGAHLAQFLERRRAERALVERSAEVAELSRIVAELRAA